MAWHELRGAPGTGVMGTVYLLHFSAPFGHARHYQGWAADLDARLAHHAAGTGANIIRRAMAAGITFELAWSAPGDRNRERQLKNYSHASRRCAVCKAAREQESTS